jgi:hypothetical protein
MDDGCGPAGPTRDHTCRGIFDSVPEALKRTAWGLAACVGLGMGVTGAAESLAVGEALPETRFVDQFDETHSVRDCPRLLFAPDRASSEMANRVLSDDGPAAGLRGGLCYVADISAMPAIITRMFAIPAMRDYPFPVLLDREGAQTANWPREPESLAVIDIVDGRIARLDFAASDAEVMEMLSAQAR